MMGYSQAKSDGALTDIAAEVAQVQGAQASTQRILGLSASHGADHGSTEEPPATESIPLNRRESDDGEQLRDRLSGFKSYILRPVAAPTSTSRDVTLRRNDLEQIRLGRFSSTAKRIASRALYTGVVASAAAIGFAIVNGDRHIQPMIVRMPSGTSSGIETDAIPSTGPAAAAMPSSALTKALESGPEAQDIPSDAAAETEHRIDGDRGDAQAAGLTETVRAEQPDAASPPARETAAAAAARRVTEITPEEPHFQLARADALVTRGDTFFAAGDVASARLFYEYAAAGNGAAALRLGITFDPNFLAQAHIGRVQGDAAIALYWYRRARDLGNRDAEVLLKRMENTTR
jgi:hypothetical protein